MSEYAADLSRRRYEEEIDEAAEKAGKQLEQRLGYFVEDGRYWEQSDRFDANSLRQLDEFWLSAVRKILTADVRLTAVIRKTFSRPKRVETAA